jgi:hypothetical protein
VFTAFLESMAAESPISGQIHDFQGIAEIPDDCILGTDFGGDLASTWVAKPEVHAEAQMTS